MQAPVARSAARSPSSSDNSNVNTSSLSLSGMYPGSVSRKDGSVGSSRDPSQITSRTPGPLSRSGVQSKDEERARELSLKVDSLECALKSVSDSLARVTASTRAHYELLDERVQSLEASEAMSKIKRQDLVESETMSGQHRLELQTEMARQEGNMERRMQESLSRFRDEFSTVLAEMRRDMLANETARQSEMKKNETSRAQRPIEEATALGLQQLREELEACRRDQQSKFATLHEFFERQRQAISHTEASLMDIRNDMQIQKDDNIVQVEATRTSLLELRSNYAQMQQDMPTKFQAQMAVEANTPTVAELTSLASRLSHVEDSFREQVQAAVQRLECAQGNSNNGMAARVIKLEKSFGDLIKTQAAPSGAQFMSRESRQDPSLMASGTVVAAERAASRKAALTLKVEKMLPEGNLNLDVATATMELRSFVSVGLAQCIGEMDAELWVEMSSQIQKLGAELRTELVSELDKRIGSVQGQNNMTNTIATEVIRLVADVGSRVGNMEHAVNEVTGQRMINLEGEMKRHSLLMAQLMDRPDKLSTHYLSQADEVDPSAGGGTVTTSTGGPISDTASHKSEASFDTTTGDMNGWVGRLHQMLAASGGPTVSRQTSLRQASVDSTRGSSREPEHASGGGGEHLSADLKDTLQDLVNAVNRTMSSDGAAPPVTGTRSKSPIANRTTSDDTTAGNPSAVKEIARTLSPQKSPTSDGKDAAMRSLSMGYRARSPNQQKTPTGDPRLEVTEPHSSPLAQPRSTLKQTIGQNVQLRGPILQPSSRPMQIPSGSGSLRVPTAGAQRPDVAAQPLCCPKQRPSSALVPAARTSSSMQPRNLSQTGFSHSPRGSLQS